MVYFSVCNPSYLCRCNPGKAVSRQTAMPHRKKAERLMIAAGLNPHLPLPKKISRLTQKSDTPDDHRPLSISENKVALPLMPIDASPSAREHPAITSDSGQDLIPVGFIEAPSSLANCDTVGASTGAAEFDSPSQILITPLAPHLTLVPLAGSRDFRFYCFMSRNAGLVGLSIKHHATESLMDDLLADLSPVQPSAESYKSFKGVKTALLRTSGVSATEHPFCAESHKALSVSADNNIIACDYKDCENTVAKTRQYQYVEVWPQLLARIQSPIYGPLMYEYFQEGLDFASSSAGEGLYTDFFSGYNFKAIQDALGGPDAMNDDIFLYLSTDGVNPFKNSKYSYWPVVLFIANLPPSERYKVHNLVPVIVIPGPKNPKDLPSFLRPLIEELKTLGGDGKVARLWDNRVARVRVHLLVVKADLVAMAKITYLSGPNGSVPCRFCLVGGVYVHDRCHTYFPYGKVVREMSSDGNVLTTVSVICDPDNLPMRVDSDVLAVYEELRVLLSERRMSQARDLAQANGFSSTFLQPSPLLELPTIFAFTSFPIDIMHLFYCNISKDIVGLWMSTDRSLQDIAVLSSGCVFDGVDQNLCAAGTGISSASSRKPRGLTERASWKATEWKHFVSTTSLIVLHEWIPKEILDGWWLFVRLCNLAGQWSLKEEQVVEIENLAKRFYMHFTNQYYKFLPERLHLCRYIYHLLLHLGDSIRANGPISMMAQWSLETFAGVLNRRCNAKDLFAESAAENIKLEAAARLYSINYNIPIPHLAPFDEEESAVSPNLRCRSELEDCQGFELQHPRHVTTVAEATEKFFPQLEKKMAEYYEISLGIGREEAKNLVTLNDDIVLWHRLRDDKAANDTPYVYRSFKPDDVDKKKRSSCYFAGAFQSEKAGVLDFYYGRALVFVEHRIGYDVHILLLASWVTRGLHCGEQNQVFAKMKRSRADLFSSASIVCVKCMSHPVSVFETQVPNRANGLSTRTYFADETREPFGFKSNRKWCEDLPSINLQGLVRSHQSSK